MWERGEMLRNCDWKNMKGKDRNLEDLGVDGNIILKGLLKSKPEVCVWCIHLAQNRVQWWDVLTTAVHL